MRMPDGFSPKSLTRTTGRAARSHKDGRMLGNRLTTIGQICCVSQTLRQMEQFWWAIKTGTVPGIR